MWQDQSSGLIRFRQKMTVSDGDKDRKTMAFDFSSGNAQITDYTYFFYP